MPASLYWVSNCPSVVFSLFWVAGPSWRQQQQLARHCGQVIIWSPPTKLLSSQSQADIRRNLQFSQSMMFQRRK